MDLDENIEHVKRLLARETARKNQLQHTAQTEEETAQLLRAVADGERTAEAT